MAMRRNYFQVFSQPILFIGILLLGGGIFAYTKMQTNLFPEVPFPRITLIVDAGQLPVERMMITVTKPLESAVKKVKGVTVVKTNTTRGSCTIDVYFSWGMDVNNLKTQLESRVNEIKNFLPPGVNISAEAMNQSLFPVHGFTLENKNASLVALRDQANLIVRPFFSQVPGMANVVVRGGKAKELVIIPDAVKMSALSITPNAIITAVNNNNYILSNGFMSDYRRLYLSLTDTRLKDVEDINKIVVKSDGERLIRLADIARIEIQEQVDFSIVNANGSQAVMIDLVKQPGINLVDFSQSAESKAEEIRKLLPKGYELKTYYNQSAFVNDSIQSVIKTIYEGLFLAIVVMIIFLRSWRASLAVMLTIPVTLAFTIIVIYLAGITINIMSLGAIAASIGLIIDDAIVIIEQIYRGHEDHPDKNRFQIVRDAIKDLFPAMVGSSLATIVIHFPFRLMSGLAGSFFRELSDTMQLTMVTSFLVTWLLLPVLHLMIGYKQSFKPKHHEKTTSINKLSWLTWTFKKPALAIGFVLVIGISAWLASGKLATGFLPNLDEGTIVLDYFSQPGTSIEETDRMCREMEKVILKNPDVETYSRRTGFRMAFKTRPLNYGDYSIQLRHDRKKSTVQVIDELDRQLKPLVPGLDIEFGQRIADLLGNLISSPQPIEVKIFGDNFKTLEKLGGEAKDLMAGISGLTSVKDNVVPAGPSLIFKPDQDKLALYHISLTDFQSQLTAYTGGIQLGGNSNQAIPSPALAALTGGLQIGQYEDGEQMRRILLRFTNFKDNDVETLKKQLIFLPDGSTRPLSFFSEVEVLPGEKEEKREDLKPVIVLTARLNNLDLGTAVARIKDKLSKELALPQGYSIAYAGAYAEQQQSFKELLFILLLATLLVFGVLMFLFKDWAVAFLVILVSVLGITGCILALFIIDIPLNVSSYTGIIMIVGIIAENAIFTVNQFNYNLKATDDVDQAINYAVALRIRPKLMTAIGAIMALTPLALGIGLGAQMQQPLAIAVIGGFIAGLPMLLFVFPSLLRWLYHYREGKSQHAISNS